MPYHRAADVVLSKWREVERQLDELSDGSPEADALQAEAMRLGELHRALLEAISRDHPQPRPTDS
jgi:hypothetical protein